MNETTLKKNRARQVREYILVLALYTILTIVMTMPAALHLTSSVIGSGGDAWQTMWRFEEKQHEAAVAVSAGELHSYVRTEFFGGGEPRLINISVWPWMWLQALFGQPLTYNIVWLLSFILSGVTTYLLIAYLLKNQKMRRVGWGAWTVVMAPLLGGVLYMFLPYHVAHALGHFGAMQTQWLPLLIVATLAWLASPTIKRSLLFVLAFTIQAWTEHHYVLWFMIILVFLCLSRWREVRQALVAKYSVPRLLGILALLVVLVGLPYYPTLRLASAPRNILALGIEQTTRFSADAFAYVVPAAFHPIWGGFINSLFTHRFTGNSAEATHFLGLVGILLVLFFHHKIPKRDKWWWGSLGLIFFLISLGPRLHLFGWVTIIPLPFALIDSWPVFSSVRAAGRASIVVGIAVAVLVAWVIHSQVKRQGMAVVIGALILLEFLFLPVPLQAVDLPLVYREVEQLPAGDLIELPAATNYTAASRALYASGYHHRNVVGSIALERAKDSEELTEVRSLPSLRQLLYLRTGDLAVQRPDFFEQDLTETFPDVLLWLNAAGIIVHTDSVSPTQLTSVRFFLEEAVGLTPRNFDDALLYDVSELKQPTDGIFMARDNRWERVMFDESRGAKIAEVPTSANLDIYNVTAYEKKVTLAFSFASDSHGNLKVAQGDHTVADLVQEAGTFASIPLIVPPGKTSLTFHNRLPSPLVITNPVFETVGP